MPAVEVPHERFRRRQADQGCGLELGAWAGGGWAVGYGPGGGRVDAEDGDGAGFEGGDYGVEGVADGAVEGEACASLLEESMVRPCNWRKEKAGMES